MLVKLQLLRPEQAVTSKSHRLPLIVMGFRTISTKFSFLGVYLGLLKLPSSAVIRICGYGSFRSNYNDSIA